MKVRNRRTGKLEYPTAEEWDKMASLGLQSRFDVLSKTEGEPNKPSEKQPLEVQSYKQMIEQAAKVEEEGSYEAAKALYERANAMKATKKIEAKIEELHKLLTS